MLLPRVKWILRAPVVISAWMTVMPPPLSLKAPVASSPAGFSAARTFMPIPQAAIYVCPTAAVAADAALRPPVVILTLI